ncbi:hypothetical protein DFH28DRAFT_932100 [Melampsora americana]|nr:hypothetical protein DFH28DRAFT_932100 [Melampsora americana]
MTHLSFILMTFLILINSSTSIPTITNKSNSETNLTNQIQIIPFKVPVKLIVMSQCPDAKKCEKVIDKSLALIGDKISVDVAYVGKLNTSNPHGISCFHGDKECQGNIQQLCYKARFPFFKDWWSFIQCQNSNILGLKHIGSNALLKECIKKTQHENYKYEDDEFLQTCINGPLGRHLLYHSISQSNFSTLHTPCQIFINHQPICKSQFSQVTCTDHHQYNSTNFINVIQEEFQLANLI